DAECTVGGEVGGTEFYDSGLVARSPVQGVHDLQTAPPGVSREVELLRTRRGVPGTQQPVDVPTAESLEAGAHQLLSGGRFTIYVLGWLGSLCHGFVCVDWLSGSRIAQEPRVGWKAPSSATSPTSRVPGPPRPVRRILRSGTS